MSSFPWPQGWVSTQSPPVLGVPVPTSLGQPGWGSREAAETSPSSCLTSSPVLSLRAMTSQSHRALPAAPSPSAPLPPCLPTRPVLTSARGGLRGGTSSNLRDRNTRPPLTTHMELRCRAHQRGQPISPTRGPFHNKQLSNSSPTSALPQSRKLWKLWFKYLP